MSWFLKQCLLFGNSFCKKETISFLFQYFVFLPVSQYIFAMCHFDPHLNLSAKHLFCRYGLYGGKHLPLIKNQKYLDQKNKWAEYIPLTIQELHAGLDKIKINNATKANELRTIF